MNIKNFEDKIDKSWIPILQSFIESEKCDEIYTYLKERKALGKVICPKSNDLWNAFKYCKYTDLKVVLVGYDPYPQVINKIPVADGLAFSSSTNKYPDSLKILHQAIDSDLYIGEETEMSNDLSFIAKQGVLMLNYSLTVEENNIGVHSKQNLWFPLYEYIINHFNNFNNGLIYQLFGGEAKKILPLIDKNNSYILTEYHPSYFARQKKPMITNIFSKTNEIIEKTYGEAGKIFWDLGIMKKALDSCPF